MDCFRSDGASGGQASDPSGTAEYGANGLHQSSGSEVSLAHCPLLQGSCLLPSKAQARLCFHGLLSVGTFLWTTFNLI
jgi:hypothetical protein